MLLLTANVDRQVTSWLAMAPSMDEAESRVNFAIRRAEQWDGLIQSPAYGDLVKEIVTARDNILESLVKGTPNKYKERGDNEKRAMIHAFNTILSFNDRVQHDAAEARLAMVKSAKRLNRSH